MFSSLISHRSSLQRCPHFEVGTTNLPLSAA
jgi:hypothetical protein